MAKKSRIDVEESSGNVFADLGLPNPEQDGRAARKVIHSPLGN